MRSRIQKNNGGFDIGGRRYLTEGAFRYGSRSMVRVGIYQLTDDEQAYFRTTTVFVPAPRANTFDRDKLRQLADEAERKQRERIEERVAAEQTIY